MKLAISIVILSLFFVFAQQCENDKTSGTPEGSDVVRIPDCIQEKITEISQQEVWNPPAKVYRYLFQEKNVYFIPQRCCDIPSQLFDENCELICLPDGGYTGKGNGACPDFFSARTDEKLIWKDKRETGS
jgi:hypothetical protein